MSSRVPFFAPPVGPAGATEVREAVLRVIASGRYVLGPEVDRFETIVAEYLGARFAVGVSSGSDALVMALLATGVGRGDEVITTPFSFVATAEAIVRVGAVPRFVDVDETSLCLDVNAVERSMSPRVRAILPVHLFGYGSDMAGLTALASTHGVPVVEDAAQALGTRVQGGRALGTLGEMGCFSFFPTKVLGAVGDAGLVVTDDADRERELRALRQHGLRGEGRYTRIGGNFRMDALQAAALGALLPGLDAALASRRRLAVRYDEALRGFAGLALPAREAGTAWNGALYTVRVRDGRRGALREHLARAGVETRIYYETPLHLQGAFASVGHRAGDFPVAEAAAAEVLSLPLHPGLTDADVDGVIVGLASFFE